MQRKSIAIALPGVFTVPAMRPELETKLIYRVHLSSGDQDYASKKEAFRQARNLSGAVKLCGGKGGIWVTEEEVPAKHPTL